MTLERKTFSPWPGFVVYRPGPEHFTILELDFEADEKKRDPEWALAAERGLGTKRFRREMRRDKTQPAGDSIYPEYAERGGAKTYVHPCPGLLDGPIHRGFDFGFWNPAMVCAQVDSTGRLYALCEWKPRAIRTRAFALGVRFLCGEIPLEALDAEALNHIQHLLDDSRYPPPPWFPPEASLGFENWCGTEAFKIEPGAESETATSYLTFNAEGIPLNPVFHSLKTREDRMRDLLSIRADGWPGLILDPRCVLLEQAFNGGLALPKPTPSNPYPTKPKEDGLYEDLHEAFGHVVVNAVPMKTQPAQAPPPAMYIGRRRVRPEEVEAMEDEGPWLDELLGWD